MALFKKKKKKLDPQEIFNMNLKYINQLEISEDVIARQFVKTETRFYLTIGEIDCPTGEIVVSDPLCYLFVGKMAPTLAIKIPPGKYPVDISLVRSDTFGIRICTAKLRIKDAKAVKYICAESTPETAIAECSDGDLTGFPVDSGTMSFCDRQVGSEYQDFLDDWHLQNENKNHYNDYFAQLFSMSYQAMPAYQREEGDFIEWANPNTNNRFVMISSGFGDGLYQSFWGYDADDEICELIVPMVNPDIVE